MTPLPRGWVEAAVDDLILERRAGYWGASEESFERPIRVKVVRNGDIRKGGVSTWAERYFSDVEVSRASVSADDLLITTSGHIGKTAVGRAGLCASNFVRILRSNPQVTDRRFLSLALQAPPVLDAMGRWSGGSTIQNLRTGFFSELVVPLPPPAEQQRLVAAIEEEFSRLDVADESLGVARVRVDRFRWAAAVDGVRGDWPEVALGDVTGEQVYGTSQKTGEDASGVPVLRMGNIQAGRIVFDKLKYLPADHPDSSRFVLKPGDILFNRTNSPELVGKSAVFKGSSEPMIFASYLIRLRLTDDCLPEWAALVINGPIGRRYIAAVRTQQVGQANVNGTKLSALPIPLPPMDEQRRIVAEAERRSSLIEAIGGAIDSTSQRSAALRRSILERAFRGELVPQDPSDEPASVLLERIRGERAAQPRPRRDRRAGTTKAS